MVKRSTEDNSIHISDDIHLRPISNEDSELLYHLMKRIYPPAYIDYWQDDGSWYVDSLYNKDNIQKEFSEENTLYSFVYYKSQLIGIIRLVYHLNTDYKLDKNYVKLHRLYLDQSIQNKGIGYKIMSWLINHSSQKGYTYLWLEVMEKQPQALHFYQKLGFEIVDKVYLDFPLLYDDYRGMYKAVLCL